MRILVTGSHGLIGSELVESLVRDGFGVVRAVHTSYACQRPENPDTVYWDDRNGFVDLEPMEGLWGIVHLAGENIAGVWTAQKKELIRGSRVRPIRFLRQAMATLEQRPAVLVCASATGIYGSRGDELLDEDSTLGGGFLADVEREVEAEASRLEELHIRPVCSRFGIVLSEHGGALERMLPVFRMGIGGKLGSGRQYWSWVALEDAVAAIKHMLFHPTLSGPVNVTSPNPVTNEHFTRIMGHVLGKPALFRVPAGVLRLMMGEMADEVLLASARVIPRRLIESGYAFHYPYLEPALERLLKPPAKAHAA